MIRTVSVIGTTDTAVDDPDDLEITRDRVEEVPMLASGWCRASGSRAGCASGQVRGRCSRTSAQEQEDTRDISRGLALIGRTRRDGVAGLVPITGGKAATFRLMAEVAVDAMCEQLGDPRPCRTAAEMLPGEREGVGYWLGSRVERRERTMHAEQLICDCELVSRSRLEEAIVRRQTDSLDDLRRVVRLGMGPCQGGFCVYRATGVLHDLRRIDGLRANAALLEFLQERWKGMRPLLFGDQLRQARLDDWIFQGLLDVEHLAGAPADSDGDAAIAEAFPAHAVRRSSTTGARDARRARRRRRSGRPDGVRAPRRGRAQGPPGREGAGRPT